MPAYWIKFKNGKNGCVEALDETAAKVSGRMVTGSDVVSIDRLPYPAEPRLIKVKHKHNDQEYHIPSFCYTPEQCKGKSCCPKSYSCTE